MKPDVGETRAKHDLRREARHLDVADLRHERHGARCTRVRLEHVDGVFGDRVLDVHEPDDPELDRDLARVLLDGRHVPVGDVDWRNDARRVARVHACILDVLHDGGHERVGAVGDGVGLALERVLQELVDEDRPVGRHADGGLHVAREHLLVVHDLHAAAAEHVARAHDERVADLVRDGDGLGERRGHACLRHRDAEVGHDHPEPVAVLGKVDRLRTGAEDGHARLLELARDVERRLTAELADDALGPLLLVYREHVFDGERLEVELVRGVVVGGDRLGIAVHHDGLEAGVAKRVRGVHAAVVELDALTDAVGPAAEDHDLAPVAHRHGVVGVVGRVVVGGVLDAAHGHGLVGVLHAQRDAPVADLALGHAEELRQVSVGEAILLGSDEQLVGQLATPAGENLLFERHQLGHLFDELALDEGPLG